MNDAGVRPFSIRALLEDRARYLVPMYQRNYAWGEGEITQLLQDVLDYQQKLVSGKGPQTYYIGHCCKVSDEAAFCLIQRPYISKTLLTRRISPRGSP